MPDRKYNSNKEELIAEGTLIVSSTDDARFQHRVEVVNLVLRGMKPSELANYISESKNTITSWVKTVDEKGFEALRSKKQSGRPSRLSREQLYEIKSVLLEESAEKYGYGVWNGVSLRGHIMKEYSVDLSLRQCERLLHTLST